MISWPLVNASPPTSHGLSRVDGGVRLASGLVVWASLLLVTYWWDAGGGIRDVTDWDSGLTSVGRLSGLWAANLLLFQVLLMSRIPLLENAFGRNRLTRTHRVVGFLSFELMLVHIGAIVVGYAAAGWSAVPGTFWELITNYSGMLLALAGTGCLIMVAVTSVKAARRRLRYESWHLLHLYAYLGVGLALPHQLWTGKEFLRSPAATVYWWTLWAAAAAAVLFWRVLLPLSRNLRHRLKVKSVVQESSDVVSVSMTGRRLDRLPVRAGQHFNVRFLDGPGSTRANPFSLSAAPDGRTLRITAKAQGEGSSRLAHLRPGTRVLFEGPFGRLSSRARSQRKVVLAGAGVGITPLRALAGELDYEPGEAILLHRYTAEPLFVREFDKLAAEKGLRVLPLPGPRQSQDSVLGSAVSDLDELSALRHWIPDLADRDVFICGPTAWTNGLTRLAVAAGVPPDHIHTETFGW
jgi:predicted ferric reductase